MGSFVSLLSTDVLICLPGSINFCATQKVPLTNGQQVRTGSCNPTPMGVILATDKCPSAKCKSGFNRPRRSALTTGSAVAFPQNLATVKAGTKFTIQMNIKNLVTGNFVNAQQNYYAAPATVDGSGTLIGHSHVVVEKIDGFQTTKVSNPNVFSFFKYVPEVVSSYSHVF